MALSPWRCAMRCSLFVLLGLSLLAVSNAEGQKNCRKGIPAATLASRATRSATSGRLRRRRPVQPRRPAATRRPWLQRTPWRGSLIAGHTYYRRGCGTANRLSPANLIYFRTEEEANRLAIAGQHHMGARSDAPTIHDETPALWAHTVGRFRL